MSEDPLEELRAEYRAELPGRFARLQALLAEVAAGAPLQRRKDLLRELHSLAGSGKTFGIPALSEAARAAESFLEPLCAEGAASSREDWARLQELVAALQGAVLPTTR